MVFRKVVEVTGPSYAIGAVALIGRITAVSGLGDGAAGLIQVEYGHVMFWPYHDGVHAVCLNMAMDGGKFA